MSAIHDSSALATDTTCVLCHAVPVANLLSGHYGKTVRTAGNNMSAGATINCYSCHDTDRFNHSGGIALGNGTNTVWGQAATNGVFGLPALGEIGRRSPELIAPFVGPMASLASDDGLRVPLFRALGTIAEAAPQLVEPHLEEMARFVDEEDPAQRAAFHALAEAAGRKDRS